MSALDYEMLKISGEKCLFPIIVLSKQTADLLGGGYLVTTAKTFLFLIEQENREHNLGC